MRRSFDVGITMVEPALSRVELGSVSVVSDPEVTDGELIERVAERDREAFEELYRRYRRRIAGFAYGMVRDHARAEDIAQEAFMSALRRMRETDRPIAFRPWIHEIARNACIDQFRRARRGEEVPFESDEGPTSHRARLARPDAGPDAALDTKERLRQKETGGAAPSGGSGGSAQVPAAQAPSTPSASAPHDAAQKLTGAVGGGQGGAPAPKGPGVHVPAVPDVPLPSVPGVSPQLPSAAKQLPEQVGAAADEVVDTVNGLVGG